MKTAQRKKNIFQRGFTLIELLVVIAIIAILAVTVFVALDPVTRFADARDARRYQDVNNVLTAVHEYIVDNGGSLPTGLATNPSATCLGSGTGCINLTSTLAKYLKSIPMDPDGGTAADTGYTIAVDANNLITVAAPDAENATVEVSR